jgi:DNA-binding LytR/AlgR family response regulator
MQQLKILIVEDDTIIAQDICDLLTEWGYDVIGIACSSTEAIALFTKNKPDIALVDIQISGALDGIQTVKQLNEIQPIPIIYLTAQADFQTVERAKVTSPAAYLLKPFDERHLHISLELALSNFSKSITPRILHSDEQVGVGNKTKLNADSILKKGNVIFIKQNYRFIKLLAEDLLYIEADRNHSYIVTKKQKIIIRIALATIVERLNYEYLLRVHRSFAINTQYIDEFDDTEIIIHGKSIPFSETYREDFLKKFVIV